MTQVCSVLSSTADVNSTYHNKRLPKGIHIIGTDDQPGSRVEEVSKGEPLYGEAGAPWGYIFIQHMSAAAFDRRLDERHIEGDYRPRCFVHRSLHYQRKASGHGVTVEERPSVSGLVFLQGTTRQLRAFLRLNYPQYFLVNDCATGEPASIPDHVMRPFMAVMEHTPGRVTFLRAPFIKFANDHIRLRVLTGPFKGQEGYVVRVNRDRQLVMNLGGYAVAISNVHNEDFEIAE